MSVQYLRIIRNVFSNFLSGRENTAWTQGAYFRSIGFFRRSADDSSEIVGSEAGFNPPIHEALGFGRSLHNALAEIHQRALDKQETSSTDVPGLLETHLHLPFAYPTLKDKLYAAAEKALDRYLVENRKVLDKVQHVEQVVEVQVSDNVVVTGRIDLIKKLDTEEVSIVDFKSTERAQPEDVTREQLHVYAVGYEQLTGRDANLIEVYNLDKGGAMREEVDPALINDTKGLILTASNMLRANDFPIKPRTPQECLSCDVAGICPLGQELATKKVT